MEITDARGLKTTAPTAAAQEYLETSLMQLLHYRRDPLATLDECLEQTPEFVMGLLFRAYLNMFSMEKSRHVKAVADVAQAERLAEKANPREAAHIEAAKMWLNGSWSAAGEMWQEIMLEYPRDIFALKAGYIADFYRGKSAPMRDRVARVLPKYRPDESVYGFLLGMFAFGLEECGDYERAEEMGCRAVELNIDDVWAIHAVAHVYEMRGRFQEGIDWMERCRRSWSEPDNFFAVHNWWHLALYHMELDHYDKVLEIYDGPVLGGQSEIVMDLEDASSMLWRCHLFGIDVAERWAKLAPAWAPHAEDALYCFNDVHAMMAFAGSGNHEHDARTLLDAMEEAARGKGDNARSCRRVGLPMCHAIHAFSQERYEQAVEWLLPIRYEHHRIGGSHAQRDILSLTLIEASLRSGKYPLARALLSERIALKPEAPGNWRKLAQALSGLGDSYGAGQASKRAEALSHS